MPSAQVYPALGSERCGACAKRVPWLTFWGNLFMTVYKIGLGIIGHSSALVADGFHSFTDVIGTTVIIGACQVAERPADEGHPYGHGKAEFIGSAFIYLLLIVVAVGLFVGGALVIIHWDLKRPSILTMLGAVISIGFNLLMYGIGQCAGRRVNSPALLANSFENRADAISSSAVVVGIGLALTIHPICDPLAAMAVGVIILVNCIVELKTAIGGLMDRALPADVGRRIEGIVLEHEMVDAVSFVMTRQVGTSYWLDLGIVVAGETPMDEADVIARDVRATLMIRSKYFQTIEVFVLPQATSKTPTRSRERMST